MIAIDSDEVAGSFGTVPGATRAQTVARLVRLVRLGAQGAMSDGAAGVLFRLADAIEAAADKRVIVLDVDELQAGIHDRVTPENLRRQGGAIEAIRRPLAARVLYCVADALDALTPPRPPEPTGLGAVVQDGMGERWVRVAGRKVPWHNPSWQPTYGDWMDIPGPRIEVLSPGVTEDGAS